MGDDLVFCVKVERKKAESLRQKLAAGGLLDGSYVPARDGKFVYFAVKGKAGGMKLVEKKLAKRANYGKPLEEELGGKLNAREMDALVKSFDIVGDIAVVEVPPSLAKKQKLIAAAIMKLHRNVKVVAKKTGGTAGEFRIRPVKVIAGEKRTTTVYREGGCEFGLDLNKAYFSSRLGTERSRIAALVKEGEHVLVPFAGVGPFAIRIGKAVPSAEVAGIELNPEAGRYFALNVALNRCRNVIVLEGDVAKLLPGRYRGWADRAVMPHPTEGARFLANVIPCLKKGGILHYYAFGDSRNPYETAEKQVKEAAGKLGRKAEIVFRRIARPYSKDTVQAVIDARIG
jgi:tRNA (guanine37-N1)-methyltransferase